MAATLKIPTIFTAVDKFSSVVRTMTKGIRTWSNKSIAAVRRFDQKISKSFSKLSNLAQIGLGLGIGAIFREGFNAITDFETGLVGVGKTTGIAGKELKNLGFDVLKLSKRLKGISSVKLLELAQVAGQMGLTSSKKILVFTETMAKLEKATDIQGAEGTAAIARLLTITGEGVGIIDKFGSSLVALGNSSAATEAEILSVASEVARGTAAYKLSSQEILGISAALKSLDVAPEAAGSAILEVFRAIELATIKGGKTLKNFGKIMQLTPKQVKETFQKTPQKAFSFFIKGLNRISDEGGSLTKTMIDVGLSGKRVAKGIIPLGTNYKLLESKINLANKSFRENNALNIEYEASTKTVNVAIKDIVKSFKNLLTAESQQGSKLEFLQKVLFGVSDNMGTILKVVGFLIAAFITMKAIVITATIVNTAYSIGLGIMGAVSGAASIAIGQSSVALGAYKVMAWLATAAQWAFNAAMLANPIVWIILAVILAIAAVILIFKNWGAITDWFSRKWAQFTAFIGRTWAGLTEWFGNFSFKEFFMDIGRSILKFFLNPIKMVLKLIRLLPGKDLGFVTKGLNFIEEITGGDDKKKEKDTLSSPEVASNKITTESIQKGTIDLNIKDPGNNVESVKQSGDLDIPIKTTSTQGQS